MTIRSKAIRAAIDRWLSDDKGADYDDLARMIEDALDRKRITHGRHCTCSSCAREDWTNPDLAPCGMHGSDCPALYQPWGAPGDAVLRP